MTLTIPDKYIEAGKQVTYMGTLHLASEMWIKLCYHKNFELNFLELFRIISFNLTDSELRLIAIKAYMLFGITKFYQEILDSKEALNVINIFLEDFTLKLPLEDQLDILNDFVATIQDDNSQMQVYYINLIPNYSNYTLEQQEIIKFNFLGAILAELPADFVNSNIKIILDKPIVGFNLLKSI